ncbi:MAG: hypothetical protein ACYC9J_09705 [Sulfuricaulis sp.]
MAVWELVAYKDIFDLGGRQVFDNLISSTGLKLNSYRDRHLGNGPIMGISSNFRCQDDVHQMTNGGQSAGSH